jgi:hypothetical protein
MKIKYHKELERLKERGFNSTWEYNAYRAKQRGFNSVKEYKDHLAKQKGLKNNAEAHKKYLNDRGYKNSYEYADEKIKEKGMSNYEYVKSRYNKLGYTTYYQYRKQKLGKGNVDYAKSLGFNSYYEYQASLLKKRGFNDLNDYKLFLAEQKGIKEDMILKEKIRQNIKTSIQKFKNDGRIPKFEILDKSGIDVEKLMEKLNKKEMNDTNYELGHKVPVFYYDFTIPGEINKCYSPHNLFWQKVLENRSNGNKIIKELIISLPNNIFPKYLTKKRLIKSI